MCCYHFTLGGFMWNDPRKLGSLISLPVFLPETYHFLHLSKWMVGEFLFGFPFFFRVQKCEFQRFCIQFSQKRKRRQQVALQENGQALAHAAPAFKERHETSPAIVANDGFSWGGTWFALKNVSSRWLEHPGGGRSQTGPVTCWNFVPFWPWTGW